MTHMHITTWVLGIVLFFVAYGLLKSGNQKGYKITHMILRVFYILIIASGLWLIISTNWTVTYIMKALLGVIVIGLMEMVLGRTSRGELKPFFWILLFVALLATIYFGLSLPQGIYIG
ncbi:YisL family protein [Peribacillus alkalitolerans]|uniref:YisL family protein n=1 Tax=Peribacillus alkalitolerans TaxID=1550385 RepID=UPI0013D08B9A|nr:YisL family protein [Peribacillus alkalitolerans]